MAQTRTNVTTTINPMCADCALYGKVCQGTNCQTWTGCVRKQRTDASKTVSNELDIWRMDTSERSI